MGSLVLPRFVSPGGQTNWRKLEQVIFLAVRFLDNILDANKYVLDKIKITAQNSRRIGLGVMGLAEYLFAKKVRYGSEESIQHIERLMRFVRDVSYSASISLAKEKGAFPKFESNPYCKAHFVKTLTPSMRRDIKEYGIRNCTLNAMPPTGTTSLLSDCTSGIEPLFSKAYRRNDRVSSRVYIHPLYNAFVDSEVPGWYVDTKDLTAKDHLEVQTIIQKYVDGSVSKTINLPKETTKEELNKLILDYIRDLKGVTVYRDGSRGEQVLHHLSDREVKEHLEGDKSYETEQSEEAVKCVSGKCEL